jgi:hypothetical protein
MIFNYPEFDTSAQWWEANSPGNVYSDWRLRYQDGNWPDYQWSGDPYCTFEGSCGGGNGGGF